MVWREWLHEFIEGVAAVALAVVVIMGILVPGVIIVVVALWRWWGLLP